jgi:hypothetical protein
MTKSNIRAGFEGAGLVPLSPETVISKLDVKLQTPTSSRPPTRETLPWASRNQTTQLKLLRSLNSLNLELLGIKIAPQHESMKQSTSFRKERVGLCIGWPSSKLKSPNYARDLAVWCLSR